MLLLFTGAFKSSLGGSRARRFTRPRRVRPGRVHSRCSRSSIPDTLCYYPASAKAGGCIGCQVARPLGKAAAPELAGLQGARTSARSAAADGGAEISYVERRRTSRPLAHRARACPGRGDAYRTYSGADGKISQGPTAVVERAHEGIISPAARGGTRRCCRAFARR